MFYFIFNIAICFLVGFFEGITNGILLAIFVVLLEIWSALD